MFKAKVLVVKMSMTYKLPNRECVGKTAGLILCNPI